MTATLKHVALARAMAVIARKWECGQFSLSSSNTGGWRLPRRRG